MTAPSNPFRIAEDVAGPHFTDRATEVDVVRRAMTHRGRLLVSGPRRMGKSTILRVAADRVRQDGGVVLVADLATAASLTEVADRLLAAVATAEPWTRRLSDWARALAPVVSLSFDPAGHPRLAVGLDMRSRREEDERMLLERVLDRIDDVAQTERAPVVLVLDEFQRLAELGGEASEWLLRNRIQENVHTAVVCAGSKEALINEMLQPKRAFYRFFERLEVGPIEEDHLARWIDERLAGSGLDGGEGVGRELVERVGPRTQDIVQAARVLWFRAAPTGRAGPDAAAEAVAEVVDQEDAALRRTWEDLTPLQQRLLRAVAAGEDALHASHVRAQYDLGPSSSVTTALDALTRRSILTRTGSSVQFDSPFFREWAVRELVRR